MMEAYLDGSLAAPERAEFEAALAQDGTLRAHLESQARIDAALGRLFADTGVGAVVAEPLRPARPYRFSRLAAAAAIVLAGLGVLFIARPLVFSGPNPLEVAYRTQVDRGFKPDVVCTTPEAFAGWMETYFGQPLYPTSADGVQLVGWAYAPVVSARSGLLLAKVNDTPVVVVVDQVIRDKQPLALPGGAGLNRFRAERGSVVLYEISPLGSASILPLISTEAPPGLAPAPAGNPG